MMNIKVNIKPLSINEAWSGKRFKTPLYKQFEQDMFYLLPCPREDIKNAKNLKLTIKINITNYSLDLDNVCKPLLDILVKKGLIKNVAIGIITGKGTKNHHNMAGLSCYIYDYFSKPLNIKELIRSVDNCYIFLNEREA